MFPIQGDQAIPLQYSVTYNGRGIIDWQYKCYLAFNFTFYVIVDFFTEYVGCPTADGDIYC